MAQVFFSYSHADEGLRDQLQKHLAVLKREGLISTWHDRRILAGDDLDGTIQKNLVEADVVLLLVSPDFLASGYCYEVEFQRALERHNQGLTRVIPIILRPCDWQSTPIGKLFALPRDGKPVVSWPDIDEAFLDVTKKIREYVNSTSHKQSVDANGISRPATLPASYVDTPRSSNLTIKKNFSDADRDAFNFTGFEYMGRFFEASLAELKSRNEGVDAIFRKIDANRFTATIYKHGKKVSACTVRIGGLLSPGISYSNGDAASQNSYNESLSVETDDQRLYFKPLGLGFSIGGGGEKKLTDEGAAELFWSMLIEPLQR